MLGVAIGAKVNLRQTLLLPETLPPGTVCHTEPVQYCTSKSVRPRWLNVSVAVGSCGFCQSSCTEKTSISATVRVVAKSICSQSGHAHAVASAQPPPKPQPAPRRSPLLTAVGG